MESRYRAVLPIVGILLVLIVALIAFFVTRKIRNDASANSIATTASYSPADDLLLPSNSPTSPAPANSRSTTASRIKTYPITGVEDATSPQFSSAFDDNGFRQTSIAIKAGTKMNWINLGSKSQQIVIDGLNSGSIAPNAQFSYQFSVAGQYTISLVGQAKTQTVNVQ